MLIARGFEKIYLGGGRHQCYARRFLPQFTSKSSVVADSSLLLYCFADVNDIRAPNKHEPLFKFLIDISVDLKKGKRNNKNESSFTFTMSRTISKKESV